MSACSLLASLPEDHFRCSICLNLFTEPVTTPCGHNFCRTCLSQRWSDSEFYLCPACNKRFHVVPEFSTNEIIAEISSQIKRRKTEVFESTDAPWQVTCDVCTEFKFKASKSCLVCLTSFCETHLETHQRVPSLMRHKLVEPVENLEEKVCKKHARILEFFCRNEQVCICLLCCETEHKEHEIVPVDEEGAKQKANIESKQAQIKLMIDDRVEKVNEFTQSSEKKNAKADKEVEDSEKLFSYLMAQVQELQSKLRSNIDKKLRKSQEKDQKMIQELQEEIAALKRKSSQLEELSQNEDHIQLLLTLQALNTMSDIRDWSTIRVYSDLYLQTLRRAMSHLVSNFQTELKRLTNTELTRMRQYKESVTFDESSAGAGLVITEFGKRIKYFKNARSSTTSGGSLRFSIPMTFGTKGFTSGRHYWEVQVGWRSTWDIGVALETVDRSNKLPVNKENGFFFIEKDGFDYKCIETSNNVTHLCPRPRHVGVYLDYEEGRVSFYDVSEKAHIHSFTGEHFTGKLYPYFYLYSKAKKSEPLVIVSIYERKYPFSLFNSFKQAETKTEQQQSSGQSNSAEQPSKEPESKSASSDSQSVEQMHT